jgi:hypothetical protein
MGLNMAIRWKDIKELPTYNNGAREVLKDFFNYHYHPEELDPSTREPRGSDANIDHFLAYLWNRGFQIIPAWQKK